MTHRPAGPWSPVESMLDGLGAWRAGTEGPVVVAVHGMEDHWRSWGPLADRLAEHYRVVALDMPWRSGNDYRWRAQGTPGEWLARALATIGVPVTAIVAHSFGANATLELLAAADTGRGRPPLDCAVLIAPFYKPIVDPFSIGLRESSAAAFARTVRDGLRVKLGARAAKLEPELLVAMGDGLVKRLTPLAFPVFFDCYVHSGELDLTRSDVPVLVLAGAEDLGLFHERAVALAADMPVATVRTYPHYGHFCHVQQAGEVAGEVAAFLGDQLLCGAPCSSHPTRMRTTGGIRS